MFNFSALRHDLPARLGAGIMLAFAAIFAIIGRLEIAAVVVAVALAYVLYRANLWTSVTNNDAGRWTGRAGR